MLCFLWMFFISAFQRPTGKFLHRFDMMSKRFVCFLKDVDRGSVLRKHIVLCTFSWCPANVDISEKRCQSKQLSIFASMFFWMAVGTILHECGIEFGCILGGFWVKSSEAKRVLRVASASPRIGIMD